jgi:hypothetical protein
MVKLKGVQVQIMRKLKNIEQNMVNDNANMLIGMELIYMVQCGWANAYQKLVFVGNGT